MPKGRVRNFSTKTLWVVETDTHKAIAHQLYPGKQSPKSIDADGVKSIDGIAIDGHTSWWKVQLDGGLGLVDADVRDEDSALTINCGGFCSKRAEGEFGEITFDGSDGWGENI